MTLANKGAGAKGGKYLVCSKARRGMDGCKYRAWRYDDVEMYIVASVKEVDLGAVLSGADIEGKLRDLSNRAALIATELSNYQKRLRNYQEGLRGIDVPPSRTILKLINELEEKITSRQAQLVALQAEQAVVGSPITDPEKFNDQLLELFDRMDAASVEDRYAIRVRLREAISRVIHKIDSFPVSPL